MSGLQAENLPESEDKQVLMEMEEELEKLNKSGKQLETKEAKKKLWEFKADFQKLLLKLAMKGLIENSDKLQDPELNKQAQEASESVINTENDLYNLIVKLLGLDNDKCSMKLKKSLTQHVLKDDENSLEDVARFFYREAGGEKSGESIFSGIRNAWTDLVSDKGYEFCNQLTLSEIYVEWVNLANRKMQENYAKQIQLYKMDCIIYTTMQSKKANPPKPPKRPKLFKKSKEFILSKRNLYIEP